MLLTKASSVSNVENTVTGPKIVDLPSAQEATVINPTIITTPLPDLHTTSQPVIKYKVLEIVEKCEVERDLPFKREG